MNKKSIGSYTLILFSAIGYALAFKVLADKGLLNLLEIFKGKHDILLVLVNYLGLLAIPTILFASAVKLNSAIALPRATIVLFVIICATLILISLTTSQSKDVDWKLLKSYETLDFKEKKFSQNLTYIDVASKEVVNGRTYIKIANEGLIQDQYGGVTTIQKVELVCSEPKFRVASVEVYGKSIKDGLGKLLRSDNDVQASIAKSFASDGRNYDGGWENHARIQRQLIRYCLKKESNINTDFEKLVNKNFCQQAQRNLDLLEEMCPIR
jgi:hypothetical protein